MMKNQVAEVLDEESIKKLKEEFPYIFEPEQKQKKNETDGLDPLEAFPKREEFTEDVTDKDLDLNNYEEDKWPGEWKKIFYDCLKKFNFVSYVQQMSYISKYNAKQKETLFAEIAKASRTAVKLAMKYRHVCSLEDMIQKAKTEICNALSGYKLEDGKFTSYSFKFIQGAIFGEISCNHDIFSFNSTSGKICKIIRKVRHLFFIKKGKYPTEEETVDKVREIYSKEIAERYKIQKARGKKEKNGEEDEEAPKPPSKKTIRQLYHLTFKIDQSTQIDQQNEEFKLFEIEDPYNSIEKLFDTEERVFTNKRRRWILGIWPDDKDKIALELYQTRNYTYEKIGKHLGVTKEGARLIYKRALKRMERAFEMSEIPYRQWMLALERLNITRAVAK